MLEHTKCRSGNAGQVPGRQLRFVQETKLHAMTNTFSVHLLTLFFRKPKKVEVHV